MKFYILYIKKSILKNFKQIFPMLLMIIFTVSLIVISTIILESRRVADINNDIENGGIFHVSVYDFDAEKLLSLENDDDVERVNLVSDLGTTDEIMVHLAKVTLKDYTKIDRFTNKYTAVYNDIEINHSFYFATDSSFYLLPFTIMNILIFVAGNAFIMTTLNIWQKKNTQYFSVLKSMGATDKKIRNITIFNMVFVTFLCIPIGVGLGAFIVKLLFFENSEVFVYTFNFSVILKIIGVTGFIIASSLYMSFGAAKRNDDISGMNLKYKKTEIPEKISFSFWYVLKKIFAEKSKYLTMVFSSVLCFMAISIMFIFYFLMSAEPINVRNFEADVNINTMGTEIKNISEETYLEIKNLKYIEDLSRIGNSAVVSSFMQHHETSDENAYIKMKMINKIALDSTKNGEKYVETNIAFRETKYFEILEPFVVEGSIENALNIAGQVIIFDQSWLADDNLSFHVGDEINLIKQCEHSEDFIEYKYEVGAVIKSSYAQHFGFYSDFPVIMSYSDYKEIVGAEPITELLIKFNDENRHDAEQALRKIVYTEKLSYLGYTNTSSDKFNKNFQIIFKKILLVSGCLIFVAVFFLFLIYNIYFINNRFTEFKILYNLGFSEQKIYKNLILENVFLGLFMFILVFFGTLTVFFIIYAICNLNPIFNVVYFPLETILIPAFFGGLINILTVIIVTPTFIKKIKNGGTEND